jgi:hypothetical protein
MLLSTREFGERQLGYPSSPLGHVGGSNMNRGMALMTVERVRSADDASAKPHTVSAR